MGDIKLFKLTSSGAEELPTQSAQVEKSVQLIIEKNLETLLGIRLLASEFSTGPVHGGRIDSLGIDEDGSPVIIEYKRAIGENVINQGLLYLDWLMDHKKDFQWLTLEILGADAAKKVDWSAPRLLCIAGDFTKYDGHAVKQINRTIELLRYRNFGNDLLMIELVHISKSPKTSSGAVVSLPQLVDADDPKLGAALHGLAYKLANASRELLDLFEGVSQFLISLGDDVQIKENKYYYGYKRIKNFVCLELYPQNKVVICYVKINPASVAIEEDFTRDVRNIGHYGTGDLEITLRNKEDFVKAQPLFVRAYEGN